MFRRIAKENARWQEGINRKSEFEAIAQGAMSQYQAMMSVGHPMNEQANLPANKSKLLNLLRRYRDDASRLNLHNYAALFSSLHFRTYFHIHQKDLENNSILELDYGKYGCRELQELQSDVRYLAWGVNQAGVDPDEYWDCKDLLDSYLEIITNDLKRKSKDGKIEILDDFASPPKYETVELIEYLQLLKPSSLLFTPPVPPREK
jgi:hypothetical protein